MAALGTDDVELPGSVERCSQVVAVSSVVLEPQRERVVRVALALAVAQMAMVPQIAILPRCVLQRSWAVQFSGSRLLPKAAPVQLQGRPGMWGTPSYHQRWQRRATHTVRIVQAERPAQKHGPFGLLSLLKRWRRAFGRGDHVDRFVGTPWCKIARVHLSRALSARLVFSRAPLRIGDLTLPFP